MIYKMFLAPWNTEANVFHGRIPTHYNQLKRYMYVPGNPGTLTKVYGAKIYLSEYNKYNVVLYPTDPKFYSHIPDYGEWEDTNKFMDKLIRSKPFDSLDETKAWADSVLPKIGWTLLDEVGLGVMF